MSKEGEASKPPKDPDSEPDESAGGEDDASTEKNGDDSHLHEDQKSPRLKT